ncbi:unnamed protein product [Cuscuta epithymum]|uniref:Reverse transcriptase zinc-binding domain-containing protein n=1 Tax=Cuscuta epithymum TaxID=186058 RepID=A0AAV0GHL6_9ASTE|nr:unnamed protein product [Cuscuta epithymum]CAH9147442.1 unnamed protein product [Cuscuta epithymum]
MLKSPTQPFGGGYASKLEQFTLSTVYNELREVLSHTFTHRHIRHKTQPMQIKIFIWKLLHNCMPITDNLRRFNLVIRPSRCPMCMNNFDTINHLFYQCSLSKQIWSYFMNIFHIPIPRRQP